MLHINDSVKILKFPAPNGWIQIVSKVYLSEQSSELFD